MTSDEIKELLRNAVRETNVADFAEEARKRGRKVAVQAAPYAVYITGSSPVGVIGDNNHIEIKVSGRSDDLWANSTD